MIDENVPTPPLKEEQPESYQIVEGNILEQDIIVHQHARPQSLMHDDNNRNRMVDAQTGYAADTITQDFNASNLSNFQVGGALFQNDTLSVIDSQHPVSQLKKPTELYENSAKSGLKKIAVSGHTVGNWQYSSKMRRTSTK